jgi:hypothetical protein
MIERMDHVAAIPPAHDHHHSVKFYGNDESLFVTVASFLAPGVVAGQPAIVVATADHREGILAQLTAQFVDVEHAQATGDLVVVDANEALGWFMVDGDPDQGRFQHSLGSLIAKTIGGRHTIVRAYGEMVDVLWKDGMPEAAIRLEILWNQLATQYGFALLCGYSMGSFYKQAEKYQDVVDQHTHVVQPDTNVVAFTQKRARIA